MESLAPDVDPFRGAVVAAYCGQATNPCLLAEGQSGGVVTALLCYLLDSGHVDRTIVTVMPEDGSLRPKPVITADQVVIQKAQGSKYCPVGVNSVIPKGVWNGQEKVAVVGLPCHIHGICNTQKHLGCWNGLFTIGLICANTLAFAATDHLIDRANLQRTAVAYFRFKSKSFRGWPGDVYIRTHEGTIHGIDRQERYLIWDAYTPLRCRLCFDRMNALSDLTVGDPWGIRRDKEGHSIAIARTQQANDALLSAQDAGVLRLEPVEPEAVFAGQKTERKRQDWTAFTEVWKQMGGTTPDFPIDKRWLAGVRIGRLKPYRCKLEWAKHLAGKQNPLDVLKAARRQLIFEKLWRIFTLKGVIGVIRRRLKNLNDWRVILKQRNT
jgi:coenzyme F420 hydrogenase subunit beta